MNFQTKRVIRAGPALQKKTSEGVPEVRLYRLISLFNRMEEIHVVIRRT